MTIILGLDPGFANLGHTLVKYGPDGKEVPLSMGLFETEKSEKKTKVLSANDNFRRTQEISRFLRSMFDGPHGRVTAVCAEAMSFPRSSSVAAKMAMAWGVIATLTEQFDIPLLQVTPMELKVALTGNKKASKEDVEKSLVDRFPKGSLDALVVDVTASKHEHPFDALGAVVACRDSDVLRMARRLEGLG